MPASNSLATYHTIIDSKSTISKRPSSTSIKLKQNQIKHEQKNIARATIQKARVNRIPYIRASSSLVSTVLQPQGNYTRLEYDIYWSSQFTLLDTETPFL